MFLRQIACREGNTVLTEIREYGPALAPGIWVTRRSWGYGQSPARGWARGITFVVLREGEGLNKVDLEDQEGYMTVCDGCRDEGWWDSRDEAIDEGCKHLKMSPRCRSVQVYKCIADAKITVDNMKGWERGRGY